MAKAFKDNTDSEVYGLDINESVMLKAKLVGAIDGELTDDILAQCDRVIIALYPESTVEFLQSKADIIKKGAVVIDCSGVKRYVFTPAHELAKAHGFEFIGGHPMAGREYSGFKYARDDLFDHASMILCGHGDDDPAVLQRARDFFMKLGFLRVQFTTPKTHDEMIAYTSQLAHVVSSAYVKCPLADKHRVARLNEDMWTELFFDNREALLPVVEDLVQRVTEYRDALRDEDREGMRKLLREGRETKERLTD